MKPSELFREANSVRKKREGHYFCATEYFDSIRVLRDDKNMTWHEIGEFFRAHGIDLCDVTITNAYKRLMRRQAEVKEELRQSLAKLPSAIV